MIDEKKLADLKKSWDASGQDVHFFSRADFDILADTLESLWKQTAQMKTLLIESAQSCRDYVSVAAILMERNGKLEIVARAAEELIKRAELICGYKSMPGDPFAIIQLKDLELALAALREKP